MKIYNISNPEQILESEIILNGFTDVKPPLKSNATDKLVFVGYPDFWKVFSDEEFNELYNQPVTPEEPQVPQVVTMRQARLQLLAQNLLSTVDAAIHNGLDEALKIEWEYAATLKRDYPSLVELATSLGLTSGDLDELFINASKIL